MSDNGMPLGLVFVGEIDGSNIVVETYLDGDIVSIGGGLWFTLDQWQRLRELGVDDEGDSTIWATTPAEYEASMGAKVGA